MQTPLTTLLNIRYPVLQAPIGNATTPELVAAVSNAGGLGMLALSWKDLTQTREYIRKTNSLTQFPFAVNLVLDFEQQDRLRICIEEKVPVVSFFWGDPGSYIQELKNAGIKVCQTVCNSEQAVEYEQKGVDFLIAQGWEAGGHVLGSVANSVLIPSIAMKVRIPVVAAGGIANGKGLLSALSLGASGVCLGTRFLMSREAGVDPVYQNSIAEASENDTLHVNRLFNIGWDNAPHRVIINSTVRTWQAAGGPEPGNRPDENEIIAWKEDGSPVVRYSDDTPLNTTGGNLEALALYAGQTAGLIEDVKPAAEIIESIVTEARLSLNAVNDMFNTSNP